MTTAYPLTWPAGWPRTATHRREDSKNRFKRTGRYSASQSPYWTFAEARDALLDEARRLGASSIVISSNFATGRYGEPVEGKRRPDDQGIALYFVLKRKAMAMAADQHQRAEENMRSLTLAIEAMRQLERHGGGVMMERAFEGFTALAAPGAVRPWRDVLGLGGSQTVPVGRAVVEHRYRELAKQRHPDAGGSADAMAELSRARDEALKEIGS